MTTPSDVAWTYGCGLGVMFTTAPVIHPFNVIAAAAAKTQKSSPSAAFEVYRGLGGNPQNQLKNYWNGLSGHLSKEIVRSWGRIGGVVYLDPMCKSNFTAGWAPHVLACVMASYEVVFANPADVWKSFRSTGLPTKLSDLFKGSLGNFWRQYMMWFVWSKSIAPINTFLKEKTNIDSASSTGIASRTALQAIACTSVTYPLELWLRTVQVRSAEYPVKGFTKSCGFFLSALKNPGSVTTGSAYFLVLSDLLKKNGIRGVGLGMTSKLVGNTILLGGANFLPMITAATRKQIEGKK